MTVEGWMNVTALTEFTEKHVCSLSSSCVTHLINHTHVPGLADFMRLMLLTLTLPGGGTSQVFIANAVM